MLPVRTRSRLRAGAEVRLELHEVTERDGLHESVNVG